MEWRSEEEEEKRSDSIFIYHVVEVSKEQYIQVYNCHWKDDFEILEEGIRKRQLHLFLLPLHLVEGLLTEFRLPEKKFEYLLTSWKHPSARNTKVHCWNKEYIWPHPLSVPQISNVIRTMILKQLIII